MKHDIFAELLQGNSNRLRDLPVRAGRFDLGGVGVPQPTVDRTLQISGHEFAVRSGLTQLSNRKWENIDFSSSDLSELQFTGCEFSNCVFDECNCYGWRVWNSRFRNCTFHRADLREAALGSVLDDRRNLYSAVEFCETDLRNSYYRSGEFVGCQFRNAKLHKVEFGGSLFTDCAFIGELEGVIFYDRHFDGKHLTPNEMVRVDFRQAQFRWVEFRRLNLDTVRFPEGDDYFRFEDKFPQALAKIIEAVSGREDLSSRKIGTTTKNKQKWLGPQQRRGVISKLDLRTMAGEDGVRLVEQAVRGLSA